MDKEEARCRNVYWIHGLLRGVSGIASALSQSGYTREALALVPSELPAINRHDLSIRTGLSGTILALCQLEEDTEEPRLSRLIESAAEQLKTAIQSHECLVSQARKPEMLWAYLMAGQGLPLRASV